MIVQLLMGAAWLSAGEIIVERKIRRAPLPELNVLIIATERAGACAAIGFAIIATMAPAMELLTTVRKALR